MLYCTIDVLSIERLGVKCMLKLFNHLTKKHYIYAVITVVCLIASLIFINHNHELYDRTIAKIINAQIETTTDVTDRHGNKDTLFQQKLIGEVMNGTHKGKHVTMSNDHSSSGAYDHAFEVGNEVFITFDSKAQADGQLKASITDVKRDTTLMIITWVFLITLLLVGKRQGLFASISLAINILILSYALDLYIHSSVNLIWISMMTVVLFTILSLLLVNGLNEKTYAAIIATLIGTFLSVSIAFGAMWITGENGLRYEEMQFLTRPYQLVFLAGLFIGSLGAVMDVAISISSALFELDQKDNYISIQALKESGIDIGKDIMGTMTNILFFAYVSGSIPILILFLKNYSSLGFTLSINLSLELARALAGGIGIVITIPIGLYTTIFFINRKREKR